MEAIVLSSNINVEVNGHQIALPPGSTLGDSINASQAPYREGTAIGILKKDEGGKSGAIIDYVVKTSKGDFRIELEDNSSSAAIWAEHFNEFEGIKVRWDSRDAVAFGPFAADIVPTHSSLSLNKYDVVLGAGGLDPNNTHMIIALEDHSSEYGTPEDGVFGKVVSGVSILSDLGSGDSIISIEPVMEWEETGEHICTTDLDTVVEDGFRIFTYIEVEIDPRAPAGAEHFFALTRHGTFDVEFASSSFISDHSLHGEMCTFENFDPRTRGSVWVRTVGYGTGKMFIARDDRPASIMHSVVGHVSHGIELVQMAEAEQKLMVKTYPEPLWLLGLSLKEAEEKLSALGIELVKKGYTEDDAVIVEQNPGNTIDVLREGKVEVTGVSDSKLVRIKLYDDLAPKTLDFFRHAIDLQFKPVGALPIMMTYEDTYIFKAEKAAEKYKEIFPENVPQGKVDGGEIGVTNQAAKRHGMVGVKLNDDDMFGPTGEKFTSTNIIGRILEPEKLKGMKDGDVMYVIEDTGSDQ
ncbi:methanogenesis marker 3 protein [Methanococcoides methylutens]|uniref:UPF0288 protein MCMEM_0132 n=1 Tax=Methanococcoides methylutens MM1 TaxID=1434104 RepID=A0A0E3WYU3_METMT|nr:methanogenesis marker 3 protein [Methanococcoides methylutens]AKB84185.1 putative methanogenesis marker protein 3 [Methanococcoides methylutens MM1]